MSNSFPPHGLSMEFSRQEYWSGLPFPSPGDLPNPGTEPRSSALRADFFFDHLSNQGSPDDSLLEGYVELTERRYAHFLVYYRKRI